jgi:hypothetical protein
MLSVCNYHLAITNAHENSSRVDRTALHEIPQYATGDVTYSAVQDVLPLGLLRREFALDSAIVESLSQNADLAKVRVPADALDALLPREILLSSLVS